MTNSLRLPITFATPAGNQTFEQTLAVAQAAEAAGFSGVAFADRPHDPGLEGWTLATAVAVRTERIRIFHTTLNVPFRFPSVLAKEAATLDLLSGGRLDLCLGAGGEPNRPLYEAMGVPLAAPGERLTDLEDAIAIMRGIWTGDAFSYEGRSHHVTDVVGEPRPEQATIPIWIGAGMPRALRLTGRVGDGFLKNGGWGSVEELADMNRRIDAAATRAGREPHSIRRILNGGGYVARDAAELDAYRARMADAAQPGRAQAGGLVGTADDVIEMIRAYREAGVDMFNVRFPAGDALEQIERFGAEIIPAVAKF